MVGSTPYAHITILTAYSTVLVFYHWETVKFKLTLITFYGFFLNGVWAGDIPWMCILSLFRFQLKLT